MWSTESLWYVRNSFLINALTFQTAHLYEYTTQREHFGLWFPLTLVVNSSGYLQRWENQARGREECAHSAHLLYERAEPEEGGSGEMNVADVRSTATGGSSSELTWSDSGIN